MWRISGKVNSGKTASLIHRFFSLLLLLLFVSPAMASLNWGGYYSDVEYEMGGQRCFSDDTWNEYLLVKCDCNQHDSMMMDGNRYSSCSNVRYSSPQECKFDGTGWKSINTYSGGVSSNAYCISRNEIGAIGVCAFCSCSDDAGVCE